MFGIGFFELLIIAVFALIFVGPKKLPEVMRQAGKFFVQIRRTANDVRSTFDQVVRDAEEEIRREEAAHMKALLTSATQPEKKADAAPATADHYQPDPHHDPHHPTPPAEQPDAPAGSRAYAPQETTAAGLTQDAKWHPVAPDAAPAEPPPPQPTTPTKDG